MRLEVGESVDRGHFAVVERVHPAIRSDDRVFLDPDLARSGSFFESRARSSMVLISVARTDRCWRAGGVTAERQRLLFGLEPDL